MSSDRGGEAPTVAVRTERMATGGEAVGRLEDGRVVFVLGAMPGESVRVQITDQKKRFSRGVVVGVDEPSPDRVKPSCAHAVNGECGGCDWMFMQPRSQREYKQGIVVEQLQRLGGIDDPQVSTPPMPRGRRTTVRCGVINGRAGYRRRRSNSTFPAESCSAADRLIEDLIVNGHFGNATEVTLRVGSKTGERMVITNADPASVRVADDVMVVSRDGMGSAVVHEIVADRSWRISAGSFFQTSREGAEALVDSVRRSLEATGGDVVDLYAGVGLLGGGAVPGQLRCVVESNTSSANDAVVNVGPDVRVVEQRVERWRASAFDAVIADPARRGLGDGGVAAIEGTGAKHLTLVSCDPASLGRDVSLLRERGWGYERAELIDMFPDTNRIEVVSTLTR